MSDTFIVAIDGLAATRGLADLPDTAKRNLARAINYATQRTAAQSRRLIREQVNFPARYLTGTMPDGKARFGQQRRANPGNLVADIIARWRPTSLAQFTSATPPVAGKRGNRKRNKQAKEGIAVQIKPGQLETIHGAILIRLRRGSDMTDTNYNLGLAIRTKGNQPPHGAYRPVKMKSGLWLLYGPSVSQVFKSVREDVSGFAADAAAREFDRLFKANVQ